MEWAYRNAYVDRLPRNVDDNFAHVTLPDPEPNPLTDDEVRQLFKACSKRTKLYLLLGLNCGYRQRDISTLDHSHLHLDGPDKAGYIKRKRNKTGSPQHHRLWPVTTRYLWAEMTDPVRNQLALLDQHGQPLQVVTHNEGKYSKTNPIGTAFNRACRKLDWPAKGIMERLRDTGAQWMRDRYPLHVVKQYLGHKERDVVRHYTTDNYDELFAALDAMNDHYKLK
jgi:integrase